MAGIEGANSETLGLAFKFVYLGCIEHQQQLVAAGDQLLALISVADYLQISALARACKSLIYQHSRIYITVYSYSGLRFN